MIDNELDVQELIQALNQHLPLKAYATPPLVQSLRSQGTDIKANEAVKIDSVLYLGDVGGIACVIGMFGTTNVVASITHLRFASDHPLARQIQKYQSRRSERLSPAGRNAKRSRARSALKAKQKKARVVPKENAKRTDLTIRFQLARRYWESGEFKRAEEAFRELFKLEHSDPHFSRYWLASCLFQLGSFDELDKLLRDHDDHSGIWRFAQALLAFRLHGDTEETQRLLVDADHLEPGFEDYLLGGKVVDARREVRFDLGEAERAFGCARLFLPAWRGVSGAATWARRILKVPLGGAAAAEVPRLFPLDELRALPLRREKWQVGLLQQADESPDNHPDEGAPIWMFCVANVDGHEIRMMTIIDRTLTETVVWNEMIQSFLSPNDGAPARPATLIVCRRDFFAAWQPLLSKIGVRCHYENDPQPVGELLGAMSRELDKRALPPVETVKIREFPQADAVWQIDFFRSPAWVGNEREGSYRPWSMLVLNKSRSIALATSHAPGDPTPEALLEFLVRTMARPNGGAAQRPREVEVSDSDCYDYLRPRLEAAGIACRLVDEMSEFNDFCLRLARSIDGSEKCAIADGKGVTRVHMESFYEAAEYYFRNAPWSRVPGEVPIEIASDNPRLGTRYAIVLGRTGVQLGLCLYDDWATTRVVLSGNSPPEGNRALAVCYDEAQIMAAIDLQLIERLGWPIATPEAWPAAMRIEPRRSPRSPSAEELVLLDACLRAIPDFINAKSASQTRRVETGTGSIELRLTWR